MHIGTCFAPSHSHDESEANHYPYLERGRGIASSICFRRAQRTGGTEHGHSTRETTRTLGRYNTRASWYGFTHETSATNQ